MRIGSGIEGLPANKKPRLRPGLREGVVVDGKDYCGINLAV